jgi:hypothetical protein
MAETLGSLCDKLTIVKLKQYHTEFNNTKTLNLKLQEEDLINEINNYLDDALIGKIPLNKLMFDSNKVYKSEGNEFQYITGDISVCISKLAEINCLLWHEQEKVYDFKNVPVEQKDIVVKQLAILNLQRNNCIDQINNSLKELIINKK